MLLSVAACDAGYISDDPDAAMQKETAPAPDGWQCGDGEISELGDEVCDGDDLGDATCESHGQPAGTLRCTEFCDAFDTSLCLGEGVCGNGIVDGDEDCEPIEGEGCVYGDEDCQICLSTCELGHGPAQFCGDETLQSDEEECDGEQLGDASCISVGFVSGTLACDEGCVFDTSGCEGAQCGDGIIEGEEECEPDETNQRCEYGTPCQVCTETCKLVEGDAGFCGDGVLQQGYEGCDGIILQDSCASLGLGDGTLACGDDCEVDLSSCEDPNDVWAADVDDTMSPDADDDAARDGTDTSGDTPRRPSDESGCAAGPAAPGFAWLLAGLLGLRRRHRSGLTLKDYTPKRPHERV